MENTPFKLFIADGEEPIEIPRELLKYFGFFYAMNRDSKFEEFSEDVDFRLGRQLWEFIISVYVKHNDLYGDDDEPLKKAIDNDNVDQTLAFLDLKMLYVLIRTFDYYDMPLFLMTTIRQVMRRLLCMTTEQLYLTHREMKRTDDSCTTVIDLIVGDCVRRSVILEILNTYIGISSIVDFMYDRFVPHQNRTIATGMHYSLVLTTRGVFSCGRNDYGGIARPSIADNFKFQRVALENVISVKAGKDTSFFLTMCGALYSVGRNNHNQLGRERIIRSTNAPEKVPLDFVLTMEASPHHVIALTADGVYTWGKNTNGQLGNGTQIPQAVPTRLAIDATIVDIGISTHYSAMLSESGDFYVCGLASYLLPTKIDLPGPVKKMVCLAFHVILIMRDESIYDWFDTTKLFVAGEKGLAPIVLTEPIRINTDRVFNSSNDDEFYALDDKGDLYEFANGAIINASSLASQLIMRNATDVIDVTGNIGHILILKKDGLYGKGLHWPLGIGKDKESEALVPTKLPLVIGHEEFADTPSFSDAKKRRIGNNRLSCHKCGSSDPTTLHLHTTSEKLFCSSSCYNMYRNPRF